MDSERFDDLTRAIAARLPRRDALRALAAVAAMPLALLGAADTGGKGKKKGTKRKNKGKKNKPPPAPPEECPGGCVSCQTCVGGVCTDLIPPCDDAQCQEAGCNPVTWTWVCFEKDKPSCAPCEELACNAQTGEFECRAPTCPDGLVLNPSDECRCTCPDGRRPCGPTKTCCTEDKVCAGCSAGLSGCGIGYCASRRGGCSSGPGPGDGCEGDRCGAPANRCYCYESRGGEVRCGRDATGSWCGYCTTDADCEAADGTGAFCKPICGCGPQYSGVCVLPCPG